MEQSINHQKSLAILNKISHWQVRILHDYQCTKFKTVNNGLAFDFIYKSKNYQATISENGTDMYSITFEGIELNATSISIVPCSFDEIPSNFRTLINQIDLF